MPSRSNITKLSDRFGDYVLRITCRRCRHTRRTPPHALAKLVGWEAPMAVLAARLRCSSCHAKDCDIVAEANRRPRGVPKSPH
jgi:hypothetical protein